MIGRLNIAKISRPLMSKLRGTINNGVITINPSTKSPSNIMTHDSISSMLAMILTLLNHLNIGIPLRIISSPIKVTMGKSILIINIRKCSSILNIPKMPPIIRTLFSLSILTHWVKWKRTFLRSLTNWGAFSDLKHMILTNLSKKRYILLNSINIFLPKSQLQIQSPPSDQPKRIVPQLLKDTKRGLTMTHNLFRGEWPLLNFRKKLLQLEKGGITIHNIQVQRTKWILLMECKIQNQQSLLRLHLPHSLLQMLSLSQPLPQISPTGP